MRRRDLGFGIVVGVGLALVGFPLLILPGTAMVPAPTATAIPAEEQARLIEAMGPPRRERPVIAIVARNDGTEVGDFLLTNGVLRRADVADVVVVAERAEPVQLYPAKLSVDPDTTMADFDARYPDGADYVVVPAMDPGTDPVVAGWIAAQYDKGARIVSVCNGSRMMGTAGLLDGRRATGHWSAIAELQAKHPTMQWVPDRRYVTDGRVTTSTGITASTPTMLALVEAIGGRDVAARVAGELGLAAWDARHTSANFTLASEHKKTFVRNALTFWRHQSVGIPVADGVDEVALALLSDAYSRTQLTSVVLLADTPTIRTRHGLVLHLEPASAPDVMLPPLPDETPALLLEAELPRIAARYDLPTAALVALVMEYPWAGPIQTAAR